MDILKSVCHKRRESERLLITGVIGVMSGGWRGVEVQLVGVQLAVAGRREGTQKQGQSAETHTCHLTRDTKAETHS